MTAVTTKNLPFSSSSSVDHAITRLTTEVPNVHPDTAEQQAIDIPTFHSQSTDPTAYSSSLGIYLTRG